MKKNLPPSELARDSRFVRATIMDAIMDPRNQALAERDLGSAKLQPDRPAAADRARNLMHGIFTGEIQALEGAGRTTFDFDDDEAPFAAQAGHGPAVLGREPPRRDLREARRVDGHRDR